MEKRLPISVCLISSAEAHRIGRTLASVAAWAREIVVVLNAEVTDGTDQVAAQYGAKVFREPWKGFIRQKNSAAEKCSQPWLLNLDADEVVPAELAREILSAVTNETAGHVAYEFPRLTFYCGRWIRHGDWYPDRVRRLWRNGKGHWAGEDPHARLEVDGAIGRLRSDLHHFTSESIGHQVQKMVSYSEAFVRQNPRKAAGFLNFAARPAWRFVRGYILRRGFLDGWQGYYIAWMNAFAVATKYARLRESQAPNAGADQPLPPPR